MKCLLFCAIVVLALGCSNGDDGYQSPAPVPPPASVPADPQWAAVAAILATNCRPCHDGTKQPLLTPAATLKASSALAKLKAGTMPPPPKTISAADKATLIQYLGG